jgi:crotonobetainyl-CoA:carnitine CoA-transferase CaiB-like acyl-CoA transferase
MARLHLAYEDVRAVNPSIIYVGAFGFDQTGPYAARPAYDDLIQGAVGLPSLLMRTGAASPRYVPATMCDRIVGQATANAILAALFHRARTGEGQAVDVPMFETMAQFILGDHFGGRTFEPPIGEPGYARMLAKFRAPYATRDGYICALIYNDKQWKSFLTLIGKPELFSADERFNSHSNRANRIDEVYAFVAAELRCRTTEEWKHLLSAGDIPWMPMNTLDELIDDPHLAATGFFRSIDHPSEGSIRTTAVPTRWSSAQPDIRRHAPRFGEHSAELLREAGYSDDEITTMAAAGVTVVERGKGEREKGKAGA